VAQVVDPLNCRDDSLYLRTSKRFPNSSTSGVVDFVAEEPARLYKFQQARYQMGRSPDPEPGALVASKGVLRMERKPTNALRRKLCSRTPPFGQTGRLLQRKNLLNG